MNPGNPALSSLIFYYIHSDTRLQPCAEISGPSAINSLAIRLLSDSGSI